MSGGERHRVVSQVAAMFDTMHDWSVPDAVALEVHQAEPAVDASVEEVVGSTMVPLPATRLRSLVAGTPAVPFNTPGPRGPLRRGGERPRTN